MLPNEPLPLGGVLDHGVALYRNTFKATIGLAFLASVPYALINGWFSYVTADLAQDPESATQVLGLFGVYFPLLYLALFFLSAAISHRIIALAREQEVALLADIAFGFKVMVPLSLLVILFLVLMFLGFMFLVIPGMIIGVSMALFPFVPVMEERSSWGALWRSHGLVWRGNWWRTAAVLGVLGMALGMGLILIAGGLEYAQASSDGVSVGVVALQALGNLVTTAVLTPFGCAAMLVVYNDLLLRKEGHDLDRILANLDPASAAPIAPPGGVPQAT